MPDRKANSTVFAPFLGSIADLALLCRPPLISAVVSGDKKSLHEAVKSN